MRVNRFLLFAERRTMPFELLPGWWIAENLRTTSRPTPRTNPAVIWDKPLVCPFVEKCERRSRQNSIIAVKAVLSHPVYNMRPRPAHRATESADITKDLSALECETRICLISNQLHRNLAFLDWATCTNGSFKSES